MDTLSRDSSSSSSNIVPMIGAFTGVIGLLLAIVALVQLSTVKKTLATQGDEVAKIATIENEVRSASSKADTAATDLKNLRDGIQGAFDKVSASIGQMQAQLTKMEEAMKKPAATAGAKGGKAAPTGVKNADGTYTVAAGDGLSKIARKFGTSVDALLAENPGLNPNKMHIGQKIKLPAGK
ncbi:MAG: LysM peptidoglycan-binding domain-containing protein [Opitutae bacterium]|nr:LysM peptidoglycan-binding domain-containing protein [Opitutae bacterium]